MSRARRPAHVRVLSQDKPQPPCQTPSLTTVIQDGWKISHVATNQLRGHSAVPKGTAAAENGGTHVKETTLVQPPST